MSRDDPFAAYGVEHTIIKPRPGGRPAAAPAAAGAQAAPPPAPPGDDAIDPFAITGNDPLLAAATPLLRAAASLRTQASCADPAALRDSLARMVRAFEQHAREGGVPEPQVVAARYVLCTMLDEAAAGTPWGADTWSRQSLLVLFHNETWGGEKVFQLLGRMAQDPGPHRSLLELAYVVLALGFEGRYRVLDDGRQQLERVRTQLYQLLARLRGPVEAELSPHWQGTPVARTLATDRLPAWVVAAAALALLAVAYLVLAGLLNRASDPVFDRIAAVQAPRVAAPAAPPPPPPTVAPPPPRLAALLAADIRDGHLAVDDRADRSVVVIHGDGFFEPASAEVSARVRPLLARIAEALRQLPGAVQVTGHTDSLPIRSVRYPSNWHLSQERAESVLQLLAGTVGPDRLEAVGRGDAQPVAPNDTAAGRARNRRVEITLLAPPDALAAATEAP